MALSFSCSGYSCLCGGEMGKTMARSMSTQSSRPLGPTLLRRLSDTAFNLRNDFTDELIFLANTSDPRGLL